MPATQEILDAIKEQLGERGIDKDKVTPEANLQVDLGLDSLDAVEMATSLEEQFSIDIPDTELENVQTVQDTMDLVEGKVGAPS